LLSIVYLPKIFPTRYLAFKKKDRIVGQIRNRHRKHAVMAGHYLLRISPVRRCAASLRFSVM
jgi:hypothetical protein